MVGIRNSMYEKLEEERTWPAPEKAKAKAARVERGKEQQRTLTKMSAAVVGTFCAAAPPGLIPTLGGGTVTA